MDLGCGSGGTSIAIANQVGPSGYVLAMDVSEPMIKRIKVRKANLRLENLTILNGDAAIFPFKTSENKYFFKYSSCDSFKYFEELKNFNESKF